MANVYVFSLCRIQPASEEKVAKGTGSRYFIQVIEMFSSQDEDGYHFISEQFYLNRPLKPGPAMVRFETSTKRGLSNPLVLYRFNPNQMRDFVIFMDAGQLPSTQPAVTYPEKEEVPDEILFADDRNPTCESKTDGKPSLLGRLA